MPYLWRLVFDPGLGKMVVGKIKTVADYLSVLRLLPLIINPVTAPYWLIVVIIDAM
jgi:hypothetical protein